MKKFFWIFLFSAAVLHAEESSGFFKIHEINNNPLTRGAYSTEGYVAMIYECPPCPENSDCKPCMPDNILISEKKKVLHSYDLSAEELLIFVEGPKKKFQVGKKYKFVFEITDKKSTPALTNDIWLIEATPA